MPDKHDRTLKIRSDLDLVDVQKAHLFNRHLPPQEFSELTLDQLRHPLKAAAGWLGRDHRIWLAKWIRNKRERPGAANQSRHPDPRALLQSRGRFLDGVTLQRIALLQLIKPIQANAAFHAGPHLVDLVLETAKRLGDPFVNDMASAPNA